jgi:flagellar protein FliO/FliZ
MRFRMSMLALTVLASMTPMQSFASDSNAVVDSTAAQSTPSSSAMTERTAQVPELTMSEQWPATESEPEFSLGWTLFRTLVVLALVVALAYLTLNVVLRRLMGIETIGRRGSPIVRVLERTALDQKRSLFVVKAGGEVLLLGGAEAGLALIAKLDAATVESLQSTPAASPVERIKLSPLLSRLLKKKGL